MKTLLLTILSLYAFSSLAQGWNPMGSRSMSMANASTTLNDVWAFHHNPGALADVTTFSVGVSYENRFLLKELQSQGIAVAIPLKVGVLSVGGQTYGYRQFRTYKGGLGYSLRLADKLYAGVQLNYLGLQLSQNYGSRNGLSAEAGIYAKFTDNWKLGVSVFNVGRTRLSDFADDRFSTLMRLGSSYRFSKKVLLAIEVEKDLDYDLRFKTGVEYEVIDDFYLRGGFATTPIELSFGLGYQARVIRFGAGSSYHQILGWSPNFSISYISDKAE